MRFHPDRYGAVAFSIHLEAELSEPYEVLFRDILETDLEEERRYAIATVHNPPNREWVDLGVIWRSEESIQFSISYGLLDFPQPPSAARKLESAIRAISEAELEFKVVSHALFRYERGMNRSIVALPIKLFKAHPSAIFDTIEGMEVVRSPRNPGEPRYVLDMTVDPEDQELVHALHIEMERTITTRFEIDFLKMAREFSREFLLDEG